MATVGHDAQVKEFIRTLGATTTQWQVFKAALTHGSCLNECAPEEADRIEANERLEFLGDAVLGLIIAEHLYVRLPGHPEGQLSKAKARLVSAEILARYARRLGLGELILLGRGEELTGGRQRDSILANALEAVIGAWFLTAGLDPVRGFVLSLWEDEFEQELLKPGDTDYKSLLQEWSQKLKQELPTYNVERIHGPDHNRMYELSVSLAGREYGRGTGRSKKEAAQIAAAQALAILKTEISK